MTLQERILEVVGTRALTPRDLYAELADLIQFLDWLATQTGRA